MPPRVLVVGSANMDLIVRCCQAPRPGETVHGDEFSIAHGGKGANQAVASSRMGAQTAFVGRVGNDDFGRALRAGLEAEGVDVRALRADFGAATGVAAILLEPSGENRIIIIGGANQRLDSEDIAAAAKMLKRSDALLMQLEIPLSAVIQVAQAARELSVLTVLDAGAATPEAASSELLGLVDVISPNESEAQTLTGLPVGDYGSARLAAQQLRALGAREVVVKLGALGAYWLGREGESEFPSFPITPVDTTAAGDAFTASLTVSLAGGMAMPEAVRRANAAGALACLTLGAQPSMPTSPAVDAFLAERE